jgi:hypothetical protein
MIYKKRHKIRIKRRNKNEDNSNQKSNIEAISNAAAYAEFSYEENLISSKTKMHITELFLIKIEFLTCTKCEFAFSRLSQKLLLV